MNAMQDLDGMNRFARIARATASLCCALAALILSCASDSPGVVYLQGVDSVTPDGLYELKSWGFEHVFVKPGARLGSYRGVLVDEVVVEYKDAPEPARSGQRVADPASALGPIRNQFRECFAGELRNSRFFSLTEQAAPDALRVSGRIADLEVDVPGFADELPTSSTLVRSAGRFILVLDVRNSLTGVTLARFTQHSEIYLGNRRQLYKSDVATNAAAVRRVFEREARRLRDHLERLRELPEVPPPPPMAWQSRRQR